MTEPHPTWIQIVVEAALIPLIVAGIIYRLKADLKKDRKELIR